MIQDFIMKTRSLLIVNCDNREYAPMNDLENPSRLLTYSPVLLVYFELPEPVNMAGDTVGTKVHMFNQTCVNTTTSKLKSNRQMSLPPFINPLVVQVDLMI